MEQNNAQRLEGVVSHSTVIQNLNLTVLSQEQARELLGKHLGQLSTQVGQAVDQALLDHLKQEKPVPPDEVRKLVREVQAKTESVGAQAMAGLLQDSNDAIGQVFRKAFTEWQEYRFEMEPNSSYPLERTFQAGNLLEFTVSAKPGIPDLHLRWGDGTLFKVFPASHFDAKRPPRLQIPTTGRYIFDFLNADGRAVDVVMRYRFLSF